MEKQITKIFNKLAKQVEEELSYGKLKQYAEATSTELLKKYIANRTNEQWDIRCSVANDELIKRGEK